MRKLDGLGAGVVQRLGNAAVRASEKPGDLNDRSFLLSTLEGLKGKVK